VPGWSSLLAALADEAHIAAAAKVHRNLPAPTDSMRMLSPAALCLLGACASAHPAPEYLTVAGAPVRPFSPAVRTNGTLYLAGQLGTDSTGKVVSGGIQPQTRQALENIRAVLVRSGSSLDKVVKCTVFLADMKDWAAMNEVYVTFFDPARRPARSALGTTGLALDGRVEIECIASE
jgi:2-iminobutanoate/2-iminopropanoate deaminase